MINNFKATFRNHLKNIPGWTTSRKILVIESDDWGGIRMPSNAVHKSLEASGIAVDKCPYNTYDSIASCDDLCHLFGILSKYKDKNGNPAIITFNVNTANPNFDAIKESGFSQYYYEPFMKTIARYYPNDNVMGLWKDGISKRLMYPQYHHREHINAPIWLELLKKKHVSLSKAFEYNVYGLSMITAKDIKIPYLAALIYRDETEKKFVEHAIVDGAEIFYKAFGFFPTSFIAPLYSWDKSLEDVLSKINIKYLQGGNLHKTYDPYLNRHNRVFHTMGSKNYVNQYYLHRNCSFEPSLTGKKFELSNILKEISIAFQWNKPAVISTHRVNFIGALHELNRNRSLVLLEELFKIVLRKWPDVEFMHSGQLGELLYISD